MFHISWEIQLLEKRHQWPSSRKMEKKRCSNFLLTSKMIKGETKKERINTHEIPADFSYQFLIFMFFYINGKRPSSSKTNEILNFSLAKSDSE